MDYQHFYPIQHGHVTQVPACPYSTLHRLTEMGVYPRNWAGSAAADAAAEFE